MTNKNNGLKEISGCKNHNRIGDIIFVHGLGGHPITTWHPQEKEDENCWLYWLGNDLQNFGIWSFGYEAEFSRIKGRSMPRFDQAKNLIGWLEAREFGERPIIFITHSLGGLLIKEMLRAAYSYKKEEFYSNLIYQTKGVVFLATPHTGSHLANLVGILGKLIQTTVSAEELKIHNPWLRDLDDWYRQNVRDLEIETSVYYETQNTLGYKVVDEDSANPKIEGVFAISTSENHISIAKPSQDDLVYLGVINFIRKLISPSVYSTFIQKKHTHYLTSNNTPQDQAYLPQIKNPKKTPSKSEYSITTSIENIPQFYTKKNEVDYSQLNQALYSRNWKEADRKTSQILLIISQRENEGWLRVKDIKQIDFSILADIDKLWLKYSKEKFGFTTHKKIWLELGGQVDKFNISVFKKFCNAVGWERNNQVIKQYNNFDFSEHAPRGHLPSLRFNYFENNPNYWGKLKDIFQYLIVESNLYVRK